MQERKYRRNSFPDNLSRDIYYKNFSLDRRDYNKRRIIETILSKGVCWSTNATPTLKDNTIPAYDISGCGCELNNLSPRTKYYVRAYATSSAGTAYGNEVRFKQNWQLSHIFLILN